MGLDVKEALAGGAGALCCAYSGNPFDVIKVRLQTQLPRSEVAASEFYTGPIDCLKKIIKEEGVLALWKGVTPSLGSAFIENAVVFSANGMIRRFYLGTLSGEHFSPGEERHLTVKERAMVGGAAGILSATCITPAEMIKVRTQIQHKKVGPLRILRDAYRENGLRGIFRGLSSTVARDVPFNFVFFGAYEAWTTILSSFVEKPSTDRRLNPFGVYIAGGMAGASGWCISFPIDSVKSRVQTSQSSASFFSMAKTIYSKFGLRGFFRGVSSAVLRAFPANAGLFLGYEMCIELLNRH
ncbi:unnamed protein product [Ectocarpus fasciculatus]